MWMGLNARVAVSQRHVRRLKPALRLSGGHSSR